MGENKTKLKVLHLEQFQNENYAVVAIEQGKIESFTLLKSDRTGTEYRITDRPLFLSDLEMLIYPQYPDILCNYYRSHKDFATNELMQKICKTKKGFDYAPILFAKITIVPFNDRYSDQNYLLKWHYIDAPEKFDAEIGDTFTSFEL